MGNIRLWGMCVMSNVASLLERSREFEEAHYSCKELLEGQINNIEKYASKWLVLGLAVNLLFMLVIAVYFHFQVIGIRKNVDHRYFLIQESLADIHKVKLDNGKVSQRYN